MKTFVRYLRPNFQSLLLIYTRRISLVSFVLTCFGYSVVNVSTGVGAPKISTSTFLGFRTTSSGYAHRHTPMTIAGGDTRPNAVEAGVVIQVAPVAGPGTRSTEGDDIGETTLLIQPSTSGAVASTSGAVASVGVAAGGDVDLEAGAVCDGVGSPRVTRGGLLGMWDRFVAIGSDRAGTSHAPGPAAGLEVAGGDDVGERAGSGAVSSNPVCLICLEPLSQADFESGAAMALECGCRGDLAVRHRACAIKWSKVKDDGRGGLPECELCRKPVKNLPELPRRPEREARGPARQPGAGVPPETMEDAYLSDPSQFEHFVPSRADVMFDCVRVTWIAMIVSILFFDANMGLALCTGFVAGMAYLLMLRVLYKQHFEAMRAYAEAQRTTRMIIRI